MIDFVIAGLPKCGTTSLYHTLNDLPDICMSTIKEPHFFAPDIEHIGSISCLEEYEALFRHQTKSQLRGEASTWYVFSDIAIEKLKSINPNIKVILVLRDPQDFLFSLHAHNLREGYEMNPDIIDCFTSSRSSNNHQFEPTNYFLLSKYALFVERLKSKLSIDNVLLIHFDSLKADYAGAVSKILLFLGIDPSFSEISLHRRNASKEYRLGFLKDLHKKYRKSAPMELIRDTIPSALKERIKSLFYKPYVIDKEVQSEFREMFINEFRREYSLLDKINA
jgi:hypothetical protein